MSEPIDIANWDRDPEFPTYPEGSREKKAVICPVHPPSEELIPRHRYIFKLSIRRHPVQFWSEVVAWRLGRLIKIPVPRTFASLDSNSADCGALIEWFYGKPGETAQIKVDGGDYMRKLIPGFDMKTGRQHNFRTVRDFFETLEHRQFVAPDWPVRWGDIFLFDALTGNTDRHQNNWAIVWKIARRHGDPDNSGVVSNSDPTTGTLATFAYLRGRGFQVVSTPNPRIGEFAAELAPAFDNGTSLGYEILDEKIPEFFQSSERLEAYIRRGNHHMKWDLDENRRLNHAEFLVRFVTQFPQLALGLRQKLSFTENDLRGALQDLQTFRLPCLLTEARLEFMLRLILQRKSALEDAL